MLLFQARALDKSEYLLILGIIFVNSAKNQML